MANIFFASDHHLSHKNIIVFAKEDGTKYRNFSCIEEHDEYLIAQHNAKVRPGDKTYFIGDVTFSHHHLHLLGRMNGEKVLIKGNHDKLKLSQYVPYFKDIRGSHQMNGILMTHIPVHPDCLARWGFNVHGHTHHNRMKKADGTLDMRYYNVSMECLNDYTPVSLEDVKKFKLDHLSQNCYNITSESDRKQKCN